MSENVYEIYRKAVAQVQSIEDDLYNLSQERYKLIDKFLEPMKRFVKFKPMFTEEFLMESDYYYVFTQSTLDSGISNRARGFKFSLEKKEDISSFDMWYGYVIPTKGKIFEHGIAKKAYDYVQRSEDFADLYREIKLIDEKLSENILLLDSAEDCMSEHIHNSEYYMNKYPELHKLMRHHDWSYMYADRPSDYSYEERNKIDRMFKELSVEDAVGMWVHFSYAPFTIMSLIIKENV